MRWIFRRLVAGQQRLSSKPLHYDLDHLAGTWSDAEATAFEASLAQQRGNYMEERLDLFADVPLDDLVKAIREQRSH